MNMSDITDGNILQPRQRLFQLCDFVIMRLIVCVCVCVTDQAAEIEAWGSSTVGQDGDCSLPSLQTPTTGQADTSGSVSSALDASLAVEEAHQHLLDLPATAMGKLGFVLSLPLLVR